MKQISPYLKLIRPSNWIKNLIIVLPLVLAGKLSFESFFKIAIGFISFSLLASAGYIINDIRDIEKDRQHIRKKHRPLASSDASVDRAYYLAIVLLILGSVTSFLLGWNVLLIGVGYFVLNYFYSVYAKNIRFVDVLILASFYVIRIFYGAEIGHVPLTGWFMATITTAVLALSLNKRYMECRISEKHMIPGRGYSKDDTILLHSLMINFATASIIFLNIHSYFVLQISFPYFYFLLNLCATGIILLYFDYSKNKSDDPVERILGNKMLLVLVLLLVFIYTFEVTRK